MMSINRFKYSFKKVLLCFILINGIFFKITYSQKVPGYLGKKFTSGYSLLAGISFQKYDKFGINIPLMHELNSEFTVSRKAVISGFIGFSNSAYHFSDYYFNRELKMKYELYSFHPVSDISKVNLLVGGLGGKFFIRQFIAPVGRYLSFHVGYYKYGMVNWEEGIKGEFNLVQHEPYHTVIVTEGYIKPTFKYQHGYLVSFGFGKIFPLNDNFFFESSNNFNLYFNSKFGMGVNEENYASGDYYILTTVYNKLKLRNMFNFKFGVKYVF